MCEYRIDCELGLVYILIQGVWMFVTTLSNFKQPTNSEVSYFENKTIGE